MYLFIQKFVLHKLKHFLRGKQDIKRKNSVMKFVSLGDTVFEINKMSVAINYIFTVLNI